MTFHDSPRTARDVGNPMLSPEIFPNTHTGGVADFQDEEIREKESVCYSLAAASDDRLPRWSYIPRARDGGSLDRR